MKVVIKNYKTYGVDSNEIDLNKKLTIVFGSNGVGKSTIADFLKNHNNKEYKNNYGESKFDNKKQYKIRVFDENFLKIFEENVSKINAQAIGIEGFDLLKQFKDFNIDVFGNLFQVQLKDSIRQIKKHKLDFNGKYPWFKDITDEPEELIKLLSDFQKISNNFKDEQIEILKQFKEEINHIIEEYQDSKKHLGEFREMKQGLSEIDATLLDKISADELYDDEKPILLKIIQEVNKTLKDKFYFAFQCELNLNGRVNIIWDNNSGKTDNLSEGERKILAFLLFIEMLEGQKKILAVIDDPISSISLDYNLIIAEYINNLSENNNVLVLTHSLYFANELACQNDKILDKVNFYYIYKKNHKSKILPITGNMPMKCEYHHCWYLFNLFASEKQDIKFLPSIPNIVRKILEYFSSVILNETLNLQGYTKLEKLIGKESHLNAKNNDEYKYFNIVLIEEDLKIFFKDKGYSGHYEKMRKI